MHTTSSGLTYPDVASNSSGSFTILNLPSTHDYTMTPSLAGYSFNPPNLVFDELLSNQTANFTATQLYENISGTVSGLGGTIIQIRYGPGKNQLVSTNIGGAYTINNLPENVSYTLTPLSPIKPPNIFRFDPPSLVIPAGNGTFSSADFIAIPQVVMSGNVSVQGKAIKGVTVSLEVYGFISTKTDSHGNYSLWVPKGVYLTPTAVHPYYWFKVGPLFTPEEGNFTQSWSTADVMATGQVKLKNGSGLQNVQLTFKLTKGVTPLYGITNANGVYNLTVTAGDTPNLASFTMTPTLAGYSISPKSQTVSPSSGFLKNFTAIPNQ